MWIFDGKMGEKCVKLKAKNSIKWAKKEGKKGVKIYEKVDGKIDVKAEIFDAVNSAKRTQKSAINTSNLFFDLGFDSLSFVKLLIDLEKKFGMEFSLGEMEKCLVLGQLVACVEGKLKEKQGVLQTVEQMEKS